MLQLIIICHFLKCKEPSFILTQEKLVYKKKKINVWREKKKREGENCFNFWTIFFLVERERESPLYERKKETKKTYRLEVQTMQYSLQVFFSLRAAAPTVEKGMNLYSNQARSRTHFCHLMKRASWSKKVRERERERDRERNFRFFLA